MSRCEYRAAISVIYPLMVIAARCVGGDDASAHIGAVESLGCTLVGEYPLVSDSSASTEDVRRGRNYRCVVHPGLPALKVALIADSSENRIVRIELRRTGDAAPFQTLTDDEDEAPYRGADVFAGRDLDNDGYLDLLLLNDWGVTGNRYYRVWRWTPARQEFVFDTTLSALSSPTPLPGRPCVQARANAGGRDELRRRHFVSRERELESHHRRVAAARRAAEHICA